MENRPNWFLQRSKCAPLALHRLQRLDAARGQHLSTPHTGNFRSRCYRRASYCRCFVQLVSSAPSYFVRALPLFLLTYALVVQTRDTRSKPPMPQRPCLLFFHTLMRMPHLALLMSDYVAIFPFARTRPTVIRRVNHVTITNSCPMQHALVSLVCVRRSTRHACMCVTLGGLMALALSCVPNRRGEGGDSSELPALLSSPAFWRTLAIPLAP